VCRRFRWFYFYWRRYLKYFVGSEFKIWVLHKDGVLQKGHIEYFPCPNSDKKKLIGGYDRKKVFVILYDNNGYEKSDSAYADIPIKYINCIKSIKNLRHGREKLLLSKN
jgi:hypothetical protein